MTHFAKHEAEHKGARRLVTRTKECVERDPKEEIMVTLGTEAIAPPKNGLLTSCPRHSGRPPTPPCVLRSRHRTMNLGNVPGVPLCPIPL